MTQTGIVRRVEGDSVWVEVNHKERGDGEPLMACCSDASTTIEARNSSHLDLKAGDQVNLVTSSKSMALPAALGFGVPLVVFFAAYITAGSLLGIANEGARAGIGIVGLLCGSIVPILYFRRRKPTDGRPVVEL